MAILRFHIVLFFLFTSFLSLISSHCLPKNHVTFFLFGDSIFDPGNNNYINTTAQANYKPYGETYIKFPSGRFSDGLLIPDYIAEYAKTPYVLPYLQPGVHDFTYGANFASSGVGALFETHREILNPIDLKTQLSYFEDVEKQLRQKLGDEGTKSLLSRAIYLISIGRNDYLVPFYPNSTIFQTYSKEEYVGMVIGNLTELIKELYEKGGRKFGFVNIEPLGCIPYVKILDQGSNGSCYEEATKLAELHNKALSLALQELESQLEGFKYTHFNFYSSLSERINNPSKYGFNEVKMACCGSGEYRGILSCGGRGGVTDYQVCEYPNEYVFFDAYHLTGKVNQQLAELMWNATDPNVSGPYNLKTLINL
ncbi:Lipase, GDSL [Corchorus olitorius]|uniref:Lipase, GDSL n=1 Tax=Corchorus olitorius TaxID=93759 RepID=A0A1R3H6N3_9ROSI|nr:Lipase, GDSL [Corchorus olitorius]